MHRHFTASVFVFNAEGKVLLLWHKRMQKWMPPGGHIDPDELPEECAVRECKEETGLDIEIVHTNEENLFAGAEEEGRMLIRPEYMLLEEIPASEERCEPAHQHMDCVFRGRLVDEDQQIIVAEAEAGEVRWFSKEEVEHIPTEHIFRNVYSFLMHHLKIQM